MKKKPLSEWAVIGLVFKWKFDMQAQAMGAASPNPNFNDIVFGYTYAHVTG